MMKNKLGLLLIGCATIAMVGTEAIARDGQTARVILKTAQTFMNANGARSGIALRGPGRQNWDNGLRTALSGQNIALSGAAFDGLVKVMEAVNARSIDVSDFESLIAKYESADFLNVLSNLSKGKITKDSITAAYSKAAVVAAAPTSNMSAESTATQQASLINWLSTHYRALSETEVSTVVRGLVSQYGYEGTRLDKAVDEVTGLVMSAISQTKSIIAQGSSDPESTVIARNIATAFDGLAKGELKCDISSAGSGDCQKGRIAIMLWTALKSSSDKDLVKSKHSAGFVGNVMRDGLGYNKPGDVRSGLAHYFLQAGMAGVKKLTAGPTEACVVAAPAGS